MPLHVIEQDPAPHPGVGRTGHLGHLTVDHLKGVFQPSRLEVVRRETFEIVGVEEDVLSRVPSGLVRRRQIGEVAVSRLVVELVVEHARGRTRG